MIDTTLTRGWLRALAPPPIVAPTVFAEREIILPASSDARPGPLRLTGYQREPIEAIADDETEIIVLMLASQTGKSTIINAIMGHCIAASPGPMLHVSPTGPRSVEFVRERFDPLVASSPALRNLIGKGDATRKGSSGGVNSVSLKTFPGGSLAFASSYKPDELAARAIRYLFLDEVDRFAHSAGTEDDPAALAIKRTKTFEGVGRKIIIVSTPTTRMGSRIGAWYARGDQRRFYVTFPDCRHSAPFAFENLERTEGKPEAAYLTCEECGVIIDEAKRRAMIESGEWVATVTGEQGIRSYHLDELSSQFSTMAAVAQQFEAAKTPEQKQAFYNTTLARVYDAAAEAVVSSFELQEQAIAIKPPYSSDIVLVTAGVDVQGNRLEATLLAHHADESHSVLHHHKLMGDPTGTAVWGDLDNVLGSTFPLSDGRVLAVAATGIDSGYYTDRALAFVTAQRAKSRRIAPVRGVKGFGNSELTRWGRRIGRQTQRLLVSVSDFKYGIYRRLARSDDSDIPAIRLPDHLPEEYFKGVAGEELRSKNVRGFTEYSFTRIYVQNEPLDCLVYALAIGRQVGRIASQSSKPAEPTSSFKELAAKLHAAHNS